MTWKHLKAETGDDHRPFWHVLTLFVPFYGLFRFHAHLSSIRDLLIGRSSIWAGEGRGAPSYLSPGWGTLILWLAGVVALLGRGQPGLQLLQSAVTVGLMVLAQAGLNGYWRAASRGAVREAAYGAGEILVTLFGAAALAAALPAILVQ